jgi:hypothetical protein
MAVMTHARNQATTADYTQLHPTAQAVIDKAMDDADNADTSKDYADAMEYVAIAAGLPFPESGDLAVCSCLKDAGGCGCGAIFDTALPGLVVTATNDPDCNLSRLQCPGCGHDHPRPVSD